MNFKILAFALLLLLLFALKSTSPVSAFEASSTSFYVRQDLSEIAGQSTSTSFKLFNNGAQDAYGLSTSTSFQIISGFIRALFQPIAPNYNLVHYHWRNDDGGETTSTSATSGIQDTALSSIAQNTLKRLRVEITNIGGTIKSFSAQNFRLEQAPSSTTCSAISNWFDVGSATGTWAMATTTNLTDGSNTTNIATATGGVTDANHTFISPNVGVKTTASQTGNISVPSDSFVELEYAVKPLASSTASSTYCFRLTNTGTSTNFSYTQYPQAIVSSGASQSITLTISPATVNLPSLSPGTAVTATSTATVIVIGGTSGYSLKISRNSTTSTIASSTDTFPDYTSWNSGSGCSAGQGNGTTTLGQNLSFHVQTSGTTADYCSSWWGANDTNGTALYSGFPTSTQTIVNSTSSQSNSGTTTSTILYRANVPASQKATNYTGGITITALANP